VLSIPPAFALSQDQTLRFIHQCPHRHTTRNLTQNPIYQYPPTIPTADHQSTRNTATPTRTPLSIPTAPPTHPTPKLPAANPHPKAEIKHNQKPENRTPMPHANQPSPITKDNQASIQYTSKTDKVLKEQSHPANPTANHPVNAFLPFAGAGNHRLAINTVP
jgi:hypothetical protein